jgi:lysophospholipase L1-like esterase
MTGSGARGRSLRRPLLASALVLATVAAVGGSVALAGSLLAGRFEPASGTASEATLTLDALASQPWPAATPSASAIPTQRHPPTAMTSGEPPLPAMLAAIGDSYSQAYDVSPSLPRNHDNLAYSWVLGDAKGDGVFSLRERLEALGASLTLVDAATSGRKMDDAVRQAQLVVAAAQSLPPGATVLVTFELGTNDLCDDPKTDPAAFELGLRAAMAILRSDLPPGSRILMLSVPDFVHFRTITQANPGTRAFFAEYRNSRRCSPFLGANSPTPLPQARAILAAYDTSLVRMCGEIEAAEGRNGWLHCTSSLTGLAERDFTIADLSARDYFHPSISGQAKMAEAAWKLAGWGGLPLPADAAR